MSNDYIVKPFRKPLTPVFKASPARSIVCQCGNDDQDKFLTVTSLTGSTLVGAVCAICETRAKRVTGDGQTQ